MRKTQLLALGASALALGAATAAVGQPAPSGTPTQIETVIVTGSNIAGVAPVGSPVLTISPSDMDDRGIPSLSGALNDLPEVDAIGVSATGLTGGNNVQHAGGNQTYATSINLRGIDPADTLNLIDGMRLVPEQSNSVYDVDVVPSLMVQRIDVVADGGSAIYGSDAITGTINLILKKPTDGVNILAAGANDPGQWSYQGGISEGQTWTAPGLGDGGVLVALQYAHSDPLFESDRPAVYFSSLTPYLGTAAPALSTSASPGNITIGTNIYAIPHGIGSTQGVTLSQLGPANQPNYVNDPANRAVSYAVPSQDSWNAGFSFNQTLTNWLEFDAVAYGEIRHAKSQSGSNAQTLTVPNTNPYSPCATAAAAASVGRAAPSQANSQGIACPANGTITVFTSFLPDFGADQGTGSRHGTDRQFSMRGGVKFDLPFGWSGSLAEEYAGDYSRGHDPNVDTTALNQTLSGVGLPSTVPIYNPFCDGHSTGPSCNNPLTINYMRSYTEQVQTNDLSETLLKLNGGIYDLPAGQVKLAIGGEYDNQTYYNHGDTTSTAAIGVPIYTIDGIHRNVSSFFEELYIPLVGGDFTLPGIQALDLDIAHRYSYVTRAGVSSNPKFGLNYTPFDGLKLRGSYGMSFRAPAISDTDASNTGILGGSGSGASNTILGIQNVTAATQYATVLATGGAPGLKAETANTFSVGANWTPSMIPGLDLDFNYFNLSLRHVIGSNERNAGVPGVANIAGHVFDQNLVFNPFFFGSRAVASNYAVSLLPTLTRGAALTQAQFNSVIAAFYASPGYSTFTPPTNPVAFLCGCQTDNSGALRMDGLDLVGNYTTDTPWGTANFGYTASWNMDLDLALTQIAPPVDELNHYTYPLRLQGRLHAGLAQGAWTGTVFFDYKNGYYADPSLIASNAPVQYQHIQSWKTFDASFGYSFDQDAGPYLHDTQVTLAVTDIFNQGPPLVLTGNVNYDGFSASNAGRTMTLTFRKKV